MNQEDLRKSWRTTQRHLEEARKQLPAQLAESGEGWSLLQYAEWLAHNELELAFDELEGLGSENNCRREFWVEMHAAAANMGLLDKAALCLQPVEEASA